MAISVAEESQIPLLEDTVDGSVDYKGRPVLRSSSGGWKSASFIIGVEIGERFAFYGIGSNLITFLTGPLGQSTATAAENVNLWSGTATLLPVLWALLADSFIGRYRTVVVASAIYTLGLSLLTLSAMPPSLSTSDCKNTRIISCSPHLQVILFFFSLYLVAVGQGGHKPCVQAFGADQFDGQDPEEFKAKSSFFNWSYFCLCASVIATSLIVSYIQENLNWALGFGIPCISMVVASIVFLVGTKTYRFSVKGDNQSPFARIGGVFIVAIRNWQNQSSAITVEEETGGTLPIQNFQQFKIKQDKNSASGQAERRGPGGVRHGHQQRRLPGGGVSRDTQNGCQPGEVQPCSGPRR